MSFFRKPTPLPVQQGGTGDAYFDAGYALIGNGYGALLELTPSTSGNVMTSNGTTWTSAPPSGGGGMVYPAAGIANSTGSAWGSSYSTSGANSVVVRDANQNISVNAINTGFTNVAAAGTTTTLTAASTPNFVVTGSGGQTYQLPDATTLSNGAIFTFNNNQSSGTIVVKNNSSTTIVTVQSGGFVVVVLLSNSIAAGTWDYHFQAPSNVSWSTNTFNYVGSITGATWNGTAIGALYGGTGLTAVGTTGNVLTSNGTSWVSQAPSGGGSQATATALGTVYAKQTTGGGTPYLTAFGYNAGVSTTGANNTAIGTEALLNNSTGSGNVAVGYQTLYTSLVSNATAIGYQAGFKCSDVSGGNSFLGFQAGYNQTSANSNTLIGVQAGFSITTNSNNTYNGHNAGYYQTGGTNTALGASALVGASGTSTGANNTAVGYQAGKAVTSGVQNTFMGNNAGSALTSGNNNIAIGGTGTFTSATSDTNTIVIGVYSGGNLNGGDKNTIIGYNASASGATVGNELVLASGSGAVGKGASTGYIWPNGGGVYQGNNSAAWSVASDQRLKKNIVDNNVGLDKVTQIQVRNFEYRTEDEVTDLPKNQAIAKQGVQLGVIAQELQQVLPDCVKTESTGVMAVEHDNIMWHMINAIKELNAEITALKAKVGT
jgi:hypothetical protein